MAYLLNQDVSDVIVSKARWGVTNQPLFQYDEVRPFPLSLAAPLIDDCSATFTLWYYLAGAPDPNGPQFNYNGYGNTDSLAANGREVTLAELKPADGVIYYNSAGATAHVALVVEVGADPLTVSHGWSGEPAYVRVSQDGRPHRFFRFDTTIQVPAPRAGSPASRVPIKYRPLGPVPELHPGATVPSEWIVYLRLCLNQARMGDGYLIPWIGGMGRFTVNYVIRFKRSWNLRHPAHPLDQTNGIAGAGVWRALGVLG